MGHHDHKIDAPSSIGCLVATVSDTRTPETDESGMLIQMLLRQGGHTVEAYRLVKDEPDLILRLLQEAEGLSAVQSVILTGGTGVTRRDRSYEAVSAALEKTLPGFGELFRFLSYQDIGSAAMLSRATAGFYRGMAVFSLPGSTDAVRLAMEKLILPELGHLIREIGR
ncbi:MAG TPA: molybdenum cofactor biosynthesis protein B [Nitrospiria bacterium]